MQFDQLTYKKLLPVVIVIFAALLGFLFYFFLQAFSASPENKKNSLGTYTNSELKVTFNYPGAWNQIGGYDYDRYGGETGFFGVSGIGGDEATTLEEVTKNAYSHPLLPYGKHPVLENLRVDGQPARLIIPSEDQDPSMKSEAQLIVHYPVPAVVDGVVYYYFVLWSDKNSIRSIIPTIVFNE